MNQKLKFKETEIGMIPEDWEVKEVSYFCSKITSGGTPLRNKKEYYDNGTISWLKTQELNDGNIYRSEEKITQLGMDKSSAKLFPKNTILMAMYGATVGKLGILKIEATTNQAFCGMIVNHNLANNKFLFYALLNERNRLINLASGAAQQNLNQDIIKKFKLPFPILLEQSAIAKILSDLDSKIELLQQQNKTLEAIGKTIFKQWFVDFEFPNEEGKPYKSSGREMVDSELGEIPNGWSVGKLGDFVESVSGCSYTSEGLTESEKALVTLKSISVNGFSQEGFKEYTGDYKEKHIVKDGDIVVAHTDLTQNRIILGKPAVVRDLGKYDVMIASMDLSIIKPGNLLNKPYLFYLLNTDAFHNYAQGHANGTTVIHLSRKAIPDFQFIIPSEEILNKFKITSNHLFDKISLCQKEILDLQKTRDLLLPKLMSGKIRVNLDE